MTQHGGTLPSNVSPVPEPTYAERARTLLHLGRTGMLATLSRKHPGHPFGSIMPYAPDDHGRPILLISTMAMHTQNVMADPRASLFVAQRDWAGDPLAAARVTLMGEVRVLAKIEVAGARERYLARHDRAADWVNYDDFAFYRLEVTDVYFVGGFAAMDWISAADYRDARPDPLAEAAAGILTHMNEDHAEALVTFARVLAGAADAEAASMVSVDRLGLKLWIKGGQRVHSARIAFPREVKTPEDARVVLIEMLKGARSRS
jgi:heme iron utilization protein